MKRYIRSSTVGSSKHTSLFKKANLRTGYLVFDTTSNEVDVAPSGTRYRYPVLNYIYDTALHVNFAKIVDNEDWKDLKAVETSSISDMFVDVLDDAFHRPELIGLKDYDRLVISVKVYGMGNDHVTVRFHIRGNWNNENYVEWMRLPADDQSEFQLKYEFNLQSQFKYSNSSKRACMICYIDNQRFELDEPRIQPDSNYMKRKIVPFIVNRLYAGFESS